MADEVAVKKESFSALLTNQLVEVKDGLPTDFNTTRFVQNAVALVNSNDIITKFCREHKDGAAQVRLGLMKAAFLGLDALNKECYLIPYGSKLDFMIDYRGNVKLAKKYSFRPIKDIYAKVVRKGDDFEETIVNGQPSLDFKPLPFNDDEIVGAFAVCLYEDGGLIYDTMSKKELDKTRSKSKASNSMAWKDFPEEMYKKVVIKRLTKHIELDFDNANQRMYYDEDMALEKEKKAVVVENPFVEVGSEVVDAKED